MLRLAVLQPRYLSNKNCPSGSRVLFDHCSTMLHSTFKGCSSYSVATHDGDPIRCSAEVTTGQILIGCITFYCFGRDGWRCRGLARVIHFSIEAAQLLSVFIFMRVPSKGSTGYLFCTESMRLATEQSVQVCGRAFAFVWVVSQCSSYACGEYPLSCGEYPQARSHIHRRTVPADIMVGFW